MQHEKHILIFCFRTVYVCVALREQHWHVFWNKLLFFLSQSSPPPEYFQRKCGDHLHTSENWKQHSGINMEAYSNKGFDRSLNGGVGCCWASHREWLCSDYKGVISSLSYFIMEPKWWWSDTQKSTKNRETPSCNVFVSYDQFYVNSIQLN